MLNCYDFGSVKEIFWLFVSSIVHDRLGWMQPWVNSLIVTLQQKKRFLDMKV